MLQNLTGYCHVGYCNLPAYGLKYSVCTKSSGLTRKDAWDEDAGRMIPNKAPNIQ